MALRQQQPVRAFLINCPPVFTSRCCKLVSDRFPIGANSAEPPLQIPEVIGDQAQSQPPILGSIIYVWKI